MKKLVIASALLLQACSIAPGGGQVEKAVTAVVDAGIEDRKAYNDKKATTILTLACDISVGAYYRLANTTQMKAIAMLCSGMEPGEPVPSLSDGAEQP